MNNHHIERISKLHQQTTVVVLLHGAGLNSLSWAGVAKLFKQNPTYWVFAYDFRGHGNTDCGNDDENLSIDNLVQDTIDVLLHVYGLKRELLQFVLVGHSAGAAVAIKTAISLQKSKELKVEGVVCLDFVEGTAVQSMEHTKQVVNKRPHAFVSLEAAIKWSVESGQIHNLQSARISVPLQLKFDSSSQTYVWRTKLEKTDVFWKDWFINSSSLFLEFSGAKMLLLANTDRLDKVLTIAQMQGKFQLKVLSSVGHFLHEEDPFHVHEELLHYLHHFQL